MSVNDYPTAEGNRRLKWRENGRQKTETVKPDKVEKAKERIEKRLGNGGETLRRKDVPTLEEFGVQYLASRKADLAPSTLRLYAELLSTHVNPVLGHLAVHQADLRPKRLSDWRDERLDDGAGPAVLGKAMTLLFKILHKAVTEYEYLEVNPLIGLDKPAYKKKAQRWLSAAEVEALRMWFLERDDIGSATLISILAYVGIRPGEALARLWTNVKGGSPGWVRHPGLDAGSLFLDSRNENGTIVPGSKTDDESKRSVYVPEPVLGDLGIWKPKATNPLFFGRGDGEPWTKDDYDNWVSRHPKGEKKKRPRCFRAAAEAVGLGSNLTPYHLRHTAATLYASAGWDHREIARQLGHSPATSARIYQHLLDERPRDGAQFTVEDFIREARGFAPARKNAVERASAGV